MGIKNNFWGEIQIKKTIQTFNFQRLLKSLMFQHMYILFC